VLALAVSVATSATATSMWPELDEGEMVRLSLCDSTAYHGRWLPGPPDSVCLRVSDGTRAAYAIRDMCRVDRRTSHAGSWMKNGFVLGAASGAVLTAAGLQRDSDLSSGQEAVVFFLFMSAGAGCGALVGGMIGALVPAWEPVTLEAIGTADPPN
jgi:hypothetical protein